MKVLSEQEGPAHCPEVGSCQGRAKLGDREMYLKWRWNPWMDGQVNGSASCQVPLILGCLQVQLE